MNNINRNMNYNEYPLGIRNEPVKLSGYYYNSKNKRENNI